MIHFEIIFACEIFRILFIFFFMKDYLILQESENRPNVFHCEHFVEAN